MAKELVKMIKCRDVQSRTQSLFMCFGGERRLGVRLRRIRVLMGRDVTKPHSYSQTLSLPTNPLSPSMFSSIRESFRARFPGSLYLGRSFSGSLFNFSLNFANTPPGTVLNCWLITREISYYY